jgi:hypothetical protein
MSKYLDAFETYMRKNRAQALAETNPHRRAILLNYNRHAALEFSDKWQYIFTKSMTVEQPQYKVQLGSPSLINFNGMDSVKGFYSNLNQRVVWLQDEELFVNDWGLASYSTFGQFVTGAEAIEGGYDVDGSSPSYVLQCPLAMFWPYSKDAKLIGEDVYQLAPFQIVKPAPEDIFGFEERSRMLSEYIGDLADFDLH